MFYEKLRITARKLQGDGGAILLGLNSVHQAPHPAPSLAQNAKYQEAPKGGKGKRGEREIEDFRGFLAFMMDPWKFPKLGTQHPDRSIPPNHLRWPQVGDHNL